MPDDLLGEFLKRDGVICPVCSYELTGIAAERCPECGEVLRLGLVAESARLGLWLTGLIALAAGLGSSGLLTFYMVFVRRFPLHSVSPPAMGLGVMGVAVGVWVWQRRRLRLATLPTRVMLTAVALLGSFATNIYVFANL
ncbi:MAG: hypothetical protein AAGI17_06480 [Planctomycetota bacterium]